MPLSEATRLCQACRRALPEPPAAPACAHCGAVHVGHCSTWDPRLRLFLAAASFGQHQLAHARSEQLGWEDALRSLIAGAGGKHPNPFGIRFEAPAIECYPIGVQLAAHWRSLGGPIADHLIDTIGRSAGLIAPTFPQHSSTRRAS